MEEAKTTGKSLACFYFTSVPAMTWEWSGD